MSSTKPDVIKKLNEKSEELGLDVLIKNSNTKNKRFAAILDNGRIVNFGSIHGFTYFDGASESKKKAYQSRHSKIKNKNGEYVYKIRNSPSYLSWHLLWN